MKGLAKHGPLNGDYCSRVLHLTRYFSHVSSHLILARFLTCNNKVILPDFQVRKQRLSGVKWLP